MDLSDTLLTHPPGVAYRCDDGCFTGLVLHDWSLARRQDWQPITYFVTLENDYMRLPHNGHMRCDVISQPDSVQLVIHWDKTDTQHDGCTFACALECPDMLLFSTPFVVCASRPGLSLAPSPNVLLDS